MCVIVFKDNFASLPSENVLRQCFRNNPDGAGLAIIRPTSSLVEIHKGFMDADSFIDFAKSAVSPEDIAAYHFRITTAGGTSPQNCHPFPVSEHVDDLKALHVNTRFAVVHNGILGKGKGKLSDTQLYIRDRLAPRHFRRFSHALLANVERETAGSRILLLDGEAHDVAKLGSGWITDNETGLAFSNETYKPRQYPAWYDCLHFDGMPATLPCPSCGSSDAELISAYHGLYECPQCTCLFDDYGDVWANGYGNDEVGL